MLEGNLRQLAGQEDEDKVEAYSVENAKKQWLEKKVRKAVAEKAVSDLEAFRDHTLKAVAS